MPMTNPIEITTLTAKQHQHLKTLTDKAWKAVDDAGPGMETAESQAAMDALELATTKIARVWQRQLVNWRTNWRIENPDLSRQDLDFIVGDGETRLRYLANAVNAYLRNPIDIPPGCYDFAGIEMEFNGLTSKRVMS